MDKKADGYPVFTRDDIAWFAGRVEALAGDASLVANVGRRKAGLDLELVIQPARGRADELLSHLTAAVCKQLGDEAAARTTAMAAVVYVEGHPHPDAAESLDYAAHQL
jgi:hypothetical protein